MRLLFLSPWFRSLAWQWAEQLRRLGHQVVVVTTPQHFQAGPARPGELILQHRPRSARSVLELPRLARAVDGFGPDIVLADPFRDPRLVAVVGNRPVVRIVHDARPHDATHELRWRGGLLERRLDRTLAGVVVFSQAVAGVARERWPGVRVEVIPLPSEMPDSLVPALVPAAQRRDFFTIGRLRPYKNLPVVVQAWQRYVRSSAYQGDLLQIIGSGELGVPLPGRAVLVGGTYDFAAIAPRLAAGKGSIAVYRAGSQSGAQLLSMQVGCPTIVSTAGGLAEYQPAGVPPVAPDDVAGLVDRLAQLTDPATAERIGRDSSSAYFQRSCAAVSAARLADVLHAVRADGA